MLPIVPPGWQGDLVDPATGQRLFRYQAEWERIVAETKARRAAAAVATPAPKAEVEAPKRRGGWTDRMGYVTYYPST
jgi:hypothetical protein